MKAKALYVPEHSVVVLDDGRPGILEKHTARRGYYNVRLNDDVAVEIKANTLLIVAAFPSETARFWLKKWIDDRKNS